MELLSNIPVLFSILAICIILYGLVLVIRLKKEVPGGVIGKQWNMLILFVCLFATGFAFGPFFGDLPAESLLLLVSLIFFFGAIYVIITIRMIYSIIQELLD